jgi:hypothetical protein
MITGAFLAESATVADHKLNVTGGVIENYTVHPAAGDAKLTLVALTQTQRGETKRDVEIKVRSPLDDAEPLIITGPLPEESARGELGFAIFGITTNMFASFEGRWVFELSAGGNTISLPLTVRLAA